MGKEEGTREGDGKRGVDKMVLEKNARRKFIKEGREKKGINEGKEHRRRETKTKI